MLRAPEFWRHRDKPLIDSNGAHSEITRSPIGAPSPDDKEHCPNGQKAGANFGKGTSIHVNAPFPFFALADTGTAVSKDRSLGVAQKCTSTMAVQISRPSQPRG